jgi:hypothetical protein
MSQVEVTKLTQHVAIGPVADAAVVSKLTMHVLLVPGSDESEPPARQGFCYAQRFGRG